MSDVIAFVPGGYRYIKGPFQYSAGVAAEPGFEIERVHFVKPLPLAEGFAAAEAYLAALKRPTTSFCACELRSPAPFTEEGFVAFNRDYVKTLERWGIFRDGVNPVARTNVCPVVNPPATPALYAFSYTVPATPSAPGSFVIAGGGEAPEFKPNYRDHIVRRGDRSPDAMREKVRYVMGVMEGRLEALGFSWKDAAVTQAYTAYDIGPLMVDEIAQRGAAASGLTWHACRPPVVELDYEMDVRRPAREIVR
jgi:hypothetical protein